MYRLRVVIVFSVIGKVLYERDGRQPPSAYLICTDGKGGWMTGQMMRIIAFVPPGGDFDSMFVGVHMCW